MPYSKRLSPAVPNSSAAAANATKSTSSKSSGSAANNNNNSANITIATNPPQQGLNKNMLLSSSLSHHNAIMDGHGVVRERGEADREGAGIHPPIILSRSSPIAAASSASVMAASHENVPTNDRRNGVRRRVLSRPRQQASRATPLDHNINQHRTPSQGDAAHHDDDFYEYFDADGYQELGPVDGDGGGRVGSVLSPLTPSEERGEHGDDDDYDDGHEDDAYCCCSSATVAACLPAHYELPTSILALVVMVLSLVVTASCAIAITYFFSIEGVRDIAALTATTTFARYNDHIVAVLREPTLFADNLQFAVNGGRVGTPEDSMAPAFNLTTTRWYLGWMEHSLSNVKHSDFSLQYAIVAFPDTQYVGCQLNPTNSSLYSCLYKPERVDAAHGNTTEYIRYVYNKQSGVMASSDTSRFQYNTLTRSWYVNTPKVPNGGIWSDVTLSSYPSVPVVTYSRALFAVDPATGEPTTFLAVAAFSLGLDRLESAFAQTDDIREGATITAFLLDNSQRIIASSLGRASYRTEHVAVDYALTAEDVANGCQRTTADSNGQQAVKVCQYTPRTFGDRRLLALAESGRLLSPSAPSFSALSSSEAKVVGGISSNSIVEPVRVKLDGDQHFVAIAPVGELSRAGGSGIAAQPHNSVGGSSNEGSNMRWSLVVMLRESDVTTSVIRGINISIILSIVIVIIVAFCTAMGLHFLLKPLAIVAEMMSMSDYLEDTPATSTAGSEFDEVSPKHEEDLTTNGSKMPFVSVTANSDEQKKAAERERQAEKERLRRQWQVERIPSRLSEVAKIQRSYWAMSDELKSLKSYIPEHLLRTVIAKNTAAAAASNNGSNRSGAPSPSFTVTSSSSSSRKNRSGSSRAEVSQSTSFAGQSRRTNPSSPVTRPRGGVIGIDISSSWSLSRSGMKSKNGLPPTRVTASRVAGGGVGPNNTVEDGTAPPLLSSSHEAIVGQNAGQNKMRQEQQRMSDADCDGDIRDDQQHCFGGDAMASGPRQVSGPITSGGIMGVNKGNGATTAAAPHHNNNQDNSNKFHFDPSSADADAGGYPSLSAEALLMYQQQHGGDEHAISPPAPNPFLPPTTDANAIGSGANNNVDSNVQATETFVVPSSNTGAEGGLGAFGNVVGSWQPTVALPSMGSDGAARDAGLLNRSADDGLLQQQEQPADETNSGKEVVGIPPLPPTKTVVIKTGSSAIRGRGGGAFSEGGDSNPNWVPASMAVVDPAHDADGPPILFSDNVLVDRDVSVVIVNIVQFHRYVLRHHGTEVTREHAEIVRFMHATARKCGGILENFLGDKFFISFNATSKCVNHAVAAVCFAVEVSNVVNKAAILGMQRAANRHNGGTQHIPTSLNIAESGGGGGGRPPTPPQQKFRAAPCGVTCGVATGRALVGPLGTDIIRRHTIISNAVPEAMALERMVIRYPNCSVMIGGDTIPIVDGYCQYLLVDATLLPSSNGKRRRIASVKAGMAMLRDGLCPEALRGLSGMAAVRERKVSPYDTINHSFNAFLEGRVEDSVALLQTASLYVAQSRGQAPLSPEQEAAEAAYAQQQEQLKVRRQQGLGDEDEEAMLDGMEVVPPPPPRLSEEQCIDISVMCELMDSLLRSMPPIDGRTYCCSAGEVYQPVNDRIMFAPSPPQ